MQQLLLVPAGAAALSLLAAAWRPKCVQRSPQPIHIVAASAQRSSVSWQLKRHSLRPSSVWTGCRCWQGDGGKTKAQQLVGFVPERELALRYQDASAALASSRIQGVVPADAQLPAACALRSAIHYAPRLPAAAALAAQPPVPDCVAAGFLTVAAAAAAVDATDLKCCRLHF